jgi:hypothetical protein
LEVSEIPDTCEEKQKQSKKEEEEEEEACFSFLSPARLPKHSSAGMTPISQANRNIIIIPKKRKKNPFEFIFCCFHLIFN